MNVELSRKAALAFLNSPVDWDRRMEIIAEIEAEDLSPETQRWLDRNGFEKPPPRDSQVTEPTADEILTMMRELGNGVALRDSSVVMTPSKRAAWFRMKRQVDSIDRKGRELDIPFGS